MPTNAELATDLYAAAGRKDLEGFLSYLSEAVVEHEDLPTPPGGTDKQRVAQWFAGLFEAFPDLTFRVEDTVSEADKVVCRVRMLATNTGPFMGAPATGLPVDICIIDVLRFADGQVVEHWGLSDDLAMLQQLGLLTPP